MSPELPERAAWKRRCARGSVAAGNKNRSEFPVLSSRIDTIDGHDGAAGDKSARLNHVIGTTPTILIFDEAVTGLCPILLLRILVVLPGGTLVN